MSQERRNVAPTPDVDLYLSVSARMRAVAAEAKTAEAQQDLARLAAPYERLAARSAWRAEHSASPPPVWPGIYFHFETRAIAANVPRAPGVYLLWRSDCWIYVGESSDLQRCLMSHAEGDCEAITREAPTAFGFEVITDLQQRLAYRDAWIQVVTPRCTQSIR